jgi:hypothetical protein
MSPTSLTKKEQLDLINNVKSKLKKDQVVKNMFKEWDVDIKVLDLVPMCFSDIDVSARTDHGIILFSNKLMNNFEDSAHYMVHELTHYLQQCYGDKPTTSSGDYLDNKFEQEGFQNQTEFISKHEGDDVAEEYIEKVLDHHDVDDVNERESRKDKLLSLARNYGL